MLLRKIKTRGFLGHLGGVGTSDNGKPAFVELDFTDADLSLVHGANGAGKSTVWDALLFCFFKEHRGGASNFARLIHDRADRAEISVEFEIDNQIWEIYGEIGKTKRGTANIVRRVCLITDENKTTKCESEEAVDAWVQKHLGMSAQTFTSAVLLRQGEADKFLRTKPKQRKEILLELLQLDFYRKLGDEATRRKNEHKKAADKVEAELAQIASDAPDDAAIKNQEKQIGAIVTTIENLSDEQKRKTVELGNARQAEKFKGEIARIEKLQTADKQLFERATEIREKHSRLCELENSLLRLEKLWEAKEEFEREAAKLQISETEIAALNADLKRLSGESTAATTALETAQNEYDEAEKNLLAAIAERDSSNETRRLLEEIEKLETTIAEKQNALAPHREILNSRDRIREDFRRYERLREALRFLREREAAEINLRKAEAENNRVKADFEGKEIVSGEIEKAVEQAKSRIGESKTKLASLQIELNDCGGELKVFRAKFSKRNSLTGEIECPTCGTTLDEQKAERLGAEIEQVKIKISELETRGSALSNSVGRSESELAEAEKEKDILEIEAQKINGDLTAVKVNFEHAARRTEDCREILEQSRQNAEGFEAQSLTEVESELAGLENAANENERLDEACRIEETVNASVQTLREQASGYPSYSAGERDEIKRSAAIYRKRVETSGDEKRAAETELNSRKRISNDLQTQIVIGESALKTEGKVSADLRRRVQIAQEKTEGARRSVSSNDADIQIACDDKSCFERLQTEKSDLQKFTAESKSLDEAEKRQNILEGEINGWRKQLNEIPLEHRRDVQMVEEELNETVINLNAEGENLEFAKNDLCEMEKHRAAYAIKQSDFAKAAKIAGLWNKLSEAFGKKGLEARIVQTAQESVKQNANSVLESLSGGAFQIELEENGSGEELQILVRDATTQNAADKARAFEFFSGGESLLIAVSLAIAIGQAVAGRTAANTLIIDEGFGALDNNRRELLVEELGRLSRDVLQGGRVIVVSHQDDVKEKFGNRFLLGKTDDGLISVDLYGKV